MTSEKPEFTFGHGRTKIVLSGTDAISAAGPSIMVLLILRGISMTLTPLMLGALLWFMKSPDLLNHLLVALQIRGIE